MSMNGAEEDGVDNRVEAPSRGTGDSSGEATPAESRNDPAARRSGAESRATRSASPAPAAGGSPSGPRPASGPAVTQPSPTFVPAEAGGSSSAAGGNGQSPAQAAAVAAMAGAASGARGIAAKVGSSFSGIGKSRTKQQPSVPNSQRSGYQTGPGTAALGGVGQGQVHQRPPQAGRPVGGAQPRRALLSLERIEPLSVMKFSFLISLVAWIIVFIAVAVIYFALSKLGVFAKIEQTVGLVTSSKTQAGSNAAAWFSASRVFTYTALVCTINAILFTALATIGAALYNLVSHISGGIEVTLKESD